CECELDVDETAIVKNTVVGLPDAAVKESLERVQAALTNTGYAWPPGRVLVNLAPADVKKEGPIYDLPIAIGALLASGVIRRGPAKVAIARTPAASASKSGGPTAGSSTSLKPSQTTSDTLDLNQWLVAGELALDGRVRPVKGVIAMAALAQSRGLRGVIVPASNALEAAVVPGIDVFAVGTLAEAVGLINGELPPEPVAPVDIATMLHAATAEIDFADVRGQEGVKRALTIAAAGSHNILMLGPAGTGKSMMAKALAGILPPLSADEAIEVTRIYSAAGMLPPGVGLVSTRPVRSPHHTASAAAIIGGGVVPRPGEVSLAHRGVLFLDELPEFPRFVLETLRQPLEDHVVTIARSHSAPRFPARFMLVAAMNPTPKGDMPRNEVGRRAMDQYLSKLSGPLIDRIDIHVEAPAVPFGQLAGAAGPRGTSSSVMRQRVLEARARASARQGESIANAALPGKKLDDLAPMTDAAKSLVGQAMTELGLSARAYDKIRRVARTIADLEGAGTLDVPHVAEAIGYRLLDRKI
ncbi:MAG: YifB family Mg chelatase-like AAA ATPase, partial [Phycisphaerales bacterium]|nr:YifB family Mg chelatase-like AAA ATPase [Phycisphaerales bacterium]